MGSKLLAKLSDRAVWKKLASKKDNKVFQAPIGTHAQLGAFFHNIRVLSGIGTSVSGRFPSGAAARPTLEEYLHHSPDCVYRFG